MKKPLNFLWISVMLNLFIFCQVRTQEIVHINLSDGTVMEIPTEDIQRFVFNETRSAIIKHLATITSTEYLANGAENMHINLSDGTVMEIPIIDIQKLTFDLQVGFPPTSEISNQVFHVDVYPNPSEKFVNIEYILVSDGMLTIDIFTMNGNHLLNINKGKQKIGEYLFRWETNKIPAGTYICRIQHNNEAIIKKVIIKKKNK